MDATRYGSTTLHDALQQRGLSSRKDNSGPQVLIQDGRDVGQMSASVGWCLIRLLDDAPTDDYRRCDVFLARRLLAGLDRPPAG